jgi:hypothetical protein
MKSTAKTATKNLLACLFVFVSLAVASQRTFAVQSAPLSWNPSGDTNVAGYRVYYGGASQSYTNSVTVGNVTNTVISGLVDGCTYYFAAKSYDSAGNESEFSNEASISSSSVAATGEISLSTSPFDTSGGQYLFSLANGAPVGVSINPTNGILNWAPGLSYGSTTNYIQVIITDSQTQSSSVIETLVVTVGAAPTSEYLVLSLPTTAVQAGQFATVPVFLNSSAGATNLLFTFAWPGNALTNVSLTLNDANMSGEAFVVNGVLNVEISNGSFASGSNVIGQLQFQAIAGQDSAMVSVPGSGSQCVKADSSLYTNVVCAGFEVAVIGAQPLLEPAPSATTDNVLTIYGNPQSTYQVETATNLSSPVTWGPAVTFTQTNLTQTVSIPNSSPVVFYRLVQQ